MPSPQAPLAVGRIIKDLTNGQPYVFMIMSYHTRYAEYQHIQDIVRDTVGLACIRADNVPGSGHDLLAKIHLLIERAELVIADIDTESPNVFYEIGFSIGAQKPLLLVTGKGREIPTDLKGREVIEYGGSKEAMEIFDQRLREHLRLRVNSRVALLRDMLEADAPQPAYIVSSPKYKVSMDRSIRQLYDRRTYGDNLGVLGLLSAFGSIMGESTGVELISAHYAAPDLLQDDVNMFLIGSPKVNPLAKEALHRIQKDREPNFSFGPLQGAEEQGDYEVALYRTRKGKRVCVEGKTEFGGPERTKLFTVDHGIILRAPHPEHPSRLIMLLAGPHSLGTGAACLAATRSPLIQAIKDALPEGFDLADKKNAFWVLVRGEISERDGLLDMDGVSVAEAGVYA